LPKASGSVQQLFEGAAYKADLVWTRASRALAKQAFALAYIGLNLSGTMALSCAALLFLLTTSAKIERPHESTGASRSQQTVPTPPSVTQKPEQSATDSPCANVNANGSVTVNCSPSDKQNALGSKTKSPVDSDPR